MPANLTPAGQAKLKPRKHSTIRTLLHGLLVGADPEDGGGMPSGVKGAVANDFGLGRNHRYYVLETCFVVYQKGRAFHRVDLQAGQVFRLSKRRVHSLPVDLLSMRLTPTMAAKLMQAGVVAQGAPPA